MENHAVTAGTIMILFKFIRENDTLLSETTFSNFFMTREFESKLKSFNYTREDFEAFAADYYEAVNKKYLTERPKYTKTLKVL